MWRRRAMSGLTLPEMLVATALVGLVLSAACNLLQVATRAYREGDSRSPAFRGTVSTLNRMATELSACERIVSPDEPTLAAGFLLAERTLVWVRRIGESEVEVVGFGEPANGGLQRWLYSPESRLDDPESLVPLSEPTRVTREGRNLAIKLLPVDRSHALLELRLDAGTDSPLTTTVAIRTGKGGTPDEQTSSE